MSETRLQAESRTEFGKGAARRIRRDHKVPAVLYGHGSDPQHITLPGHDTWLALKHGGANALLAIELEGKTQLVLPKQVQRDAIKGTLEHLDLLIVKKGEKVVVEVPVHTVGDAAADTLVTIEHATVTLEAEATHIPEAIEVSIEGAEAGTQILAKDLDLPKGSSLHIDEDSLVVNVTAQVELDTEFEGEESGEATDAGESGEESSEGASAESAEAEAPSGE